MSLSSCQFELASARMAMVERNPNDFTVSELKEVLRGMGLSTSDIKSELIARIFEKDPSGGWRVCRTSETRR